MSAQVLSLDWETRGVLDLQECGLWNYARDKNTDLWCAAYAFSDEEPEIWTPGQPCPPRIVAHVAAGGAIHAWNAPFEIALWQQVATPRHGWPKVGPELFYCSMAQAYATGLPGGLEDAALALGLAVLKDSEGRNLMLRLARPRRMEGATPIWWQEPEKLARLLAYSQQDVRVERETRKRLPPLSEKERRVWLLDFVINQRGVAVDLETARAGSKMSEEIKENAGRELAILTDGAVTTPNALIPLKQWLVAHGCDAAQDSLDKDSVSALLLNNKYAPEVHAALLVRQEAGKASVAKLERIQQLAGSDGRLHNWGQYYGASTGRWAARGVQVHNLVRDMPKPHIVEEILGHVKDGALDWISMAYGPPMTMISRCLRSFFVAPKGRKLIAGDFSGVEGRGTAWLAGEEWKLRAFRAADAKTGPGIYELAAHKTLGTPFEQITKDSAERQIGKVQELAFGYQGGVGAARKFLPASMSHLPDETLNAWKLAWRRAHPAIAGREVVSQSTGRTYMQGGLWRELEDAAVNAVSDPGVAYSAGFPGRGVQFKKAGSFLWCQLPSKRVICYPYPKLLPGQYRPQLTYMTVPGEADKVRGNIIEDVKNANNWARVSTYGGSLTENLVQALCRDLLVDCMLALHNKGAQIVLHVHDEAIIEVADLSAEGARKAMQEIMRQPPVWAKDFPLHAECNVMQRYGKG